MVKRILLSSTAVVTAMAFSTSVAFANPHHKNNPTNTTINVCTSINNNKTKVNTGNVQWSSTGNANVSKNTGGGDATTGDSSNSNSTGVTVAVANTNPCTSPIQGTDVVTDTPSTFNGTFLTSINNNKTTINTFSIQGSSTGNANVSKNTDGGDANSGGSSNSNDTTVIVSVSNN